MFRKISMLLILLTILVACSPAAETPAATPTSTTAVDNANGAASETSESTVPDAGASTGGEVIQTFTLPGDNVFPEGIAYDVATGNFYVGSTRDGSVYRGNVEGPAEMEMFLEPNPDEREGITGMKVDEAGRLWIAGRFSGRVFVYDTATGELIRALDTPAAENTLINDLTLTDEAAYVTDSLRPVLFRVPFTLDEVGEIEPWLDFTETPLEYRGGDSFNARINLNGIAASNDGQYLITVQFNTGELYRIDIATQEIVQIDIGGETLRTGDGLVLDGQTLYVTLESPAGIVPIALAADFASGEVGEAISDPSLRLPTTIAQVDDRLLVVNSQLNMSGDSPDLELPFTISSLPIPSDSASEESASPRTFAIIPAESEAAYVVDEEFFDGALSAVGVEPGRVDIVGSTQEIGGELTLDLNNLSAALGENYFEVNIESLTSDQSGRDRRIRGYDLQSSRYPLASFRAMAIESAPASYSDGDEVTFQLIGNLTVRETVRPTIFDVTASLDGNTIRGVATADVAMTDFGFNPPSWRGVYSVEDEFAIRVSFVAREQ